MQSLLSALKPYETYLNIREQELMSAHTTFRIGGPADLYVEWKSGAPLEEILPILRASGQPLYILGRGSNVLVHDAGVRGIVLNSSAANQITCEGTKITAESGAGLASIASTALRESLTGFEFAAGIPGSLGGAVCMNAGAYGGEMVQVVTRSRYITPEGELGVIEGDAHQFGYRHSVYKDHPDWLVLQAELELQKGEPTEIRSMMEDLAQRRRDKQPLNYPSAGSTFKRPTGYFAGRLIEDCGLKGYAIGGAQVSEKHAGFLINRGGATCDDMLRLVGHVQNTVQERFGVELECEIRVW
ncbi:MAG: UDP-N-acetylmuramate dehydrogenase [Butyricicoccus sp.]|nr:UDP-N-acetylmuramate dehydrogenase [Butyricicoccus sp.]MBQ8585732.1 UDP-N-acetylmuramate dehydrogenase [Butyricicoccus sp.]